VKRNSTLGFYFVIAVSWSLIFLDSAPTPVAHAESPNGKLEGVWEATRDFGPAVAGTLDVMQIDGGWRAVIAQYDLPVNVKDGRISLVLPGEQGWFDGRLTKDGSTILGHWTQPPTVNSGKKFGSPVVLRSIGKNRWQGEVVPLKDEFTLFLVLTRRPDGSLGAVIRNPDRNIGINWRVDRLEQDGNRLKLIGKISPEGAAGVWPIRDKEQERIVAEGVYHAANNRVSLYFDRGGTYDFAPAGPDSNFYARGKDPAPYQYKAPIADNDGWTVGTLKEVGMTPESIGDLVRTVSAPFTSLEEPYLHGILVARHGKLVLEEYFHGFHRHKPHDTRSASKSLTSTLVGAAILNGAKLDPSTKVYDLLYKGALPTDLDPRKKEMSVEHLLNMASGYDCDDRVYPPRPGNEDTMLALNTDYYQHTLKLPMDGQPGSRIAYCSIDPNLLGAVLSAASGKPLADLFQDLIAGPLQMKHYYFYLQPTGEPYMGGSIQWIPRDFMKLGQLMLNDGVWNGKRVVSKEWARRASTPMVKIKTRGATSCVEGSTPTLCLRQYGYLWWHYDFPYRGRTVHAYYAGGNGGQTVVVIPELDMVLSTWAGNYASLVGLKIQEELIPKYILPAIKD
jgi:CubicO group peptidase (beta-lactamase class C family)